MVYIIFALHCAQKIMYCMRKLCFFIFLNSRCLRCFRCLRCALRCFLNNNVILFFRCDNNFSAAKIIFALRKSFFRCENHFSAAKIIFALRKSFFRCENLFSAAKNFCLQRKVPLLPLLALRAAVLLFSFS